MASDPTCPACGRSWLRHPGCELLCRRDRLKDELLGRAAELLHQVACGHPTPLSDVQELQRQIDDVRGLV